MISRLIPFIHLLRRLAALALPLALLGSCYLPNQFEAEVRISRYGSYSLTYTGILIYAPIFEDHKNGKLTDEQLKAKMDVLERDLRRDENFKEIKATGPAQFKVKFEKLGRIEGPMHFAFVRRSADVLTVRVLSSGVLIVHGAPMTPEAVQRITETGMTIYGSLRVVTDIPPERVLENNSHKTEEVGISRIYSWKIVSAEQKMPKIAMRFW